MSSLARDWEAKFAGEPAMRHPATDYCTGCQREIDVREKMIKHLLGKLCVTECTIDPATCDLTSTKTLTLTTSPKGLTASIRMPQTRGDSWWMENSE